MFARSAQSTRIMRPACPSAASVSHKLDRVGPSREHVFGGVVRVPYPLNAMQKAVADHAGKFFANAARRQILIDLIERADARMGTAVSLRAMDWFCTNYAKKYGVQILLPGRAPLQVHAAYRDASSYYRRRLFDVFRRRPQHHVFLVCPDTGKECTTTLGQLNFVMWALRTGVYEYCVTHRRHIERDQSDTNSAVRAQKAKALAQGRARKRQELSRAAPCAARIVCHPVRQRMGAR